MQKHVIEHAGIPVGIVIPFEQSLKFVAVKFQVMGLDGQRFDTLVDVRRAVYNYLKPANDPISATAA